MRRRVLLRVVQQHWAGAAYARFGKLPFGTQLANSSAGIARGANISARPFEEQMKRLNLIHAARWFVISRLPAKEDRQLRKLLFFVSNFDRDVPGYVEAFVDGFGEGGLATQWADAPGWPRRAASVATLLDFATKQNVAAVHEFKAHPDVSTNDVRSALQVSRSIQTLCRETTALRAQDTRDVEAFDERFYDCLGRIQPCLGQLSGGPGEVVDTDAHPRSPRHSFLLLVPFVRDSVTDVIDAIREIDADTLRSVHQTHTARIGVLHSVYDAGDGRHRCLRHGYILLSAEFHTGDGETNWSDACRKYLTAVFEATQATGMWAPAMAHRGVEGAEFLSYLCRRGRWPVRRGPLYRPTMSFVDYPRVTPAAVADALRMHAAFETLLQQHARSNDLHMPLDRFRETVGATS